MASYSKVFTRGSGTGWLRLGYRNIGVLQTTVAEIVTEKEHQRKKSHCHSVADNLTHSSFCICHNALCMGIWVSLVMRLQPSILADSLQIHIRPVDRRSACRTVQKLPGILRARNNVGSIPFLAAQPGLRRNPNDRDCSWYSVPRGDASRDEI